MVSQSPLGSCDPRKLCISWASPSRFEILFPFFRARVVGSDDSHVLPVYVSPEQCMERFLTLSSQEQVARKVFVLRVRFDDLVALSGSNDRLASNEALLQAHVDMVRPENPATMKTVPDERYRIVKELSFCHLSTIARVYRSV